jgi:rod shape-determining protein MreC
VVGVLIAISLALITVSFGGPTSGPLHQAEGVGATILHPFQVAATRVAQPFRDAYSWVDGLLGAKAENRRLRRENIALRAQLIANQGEARDAAQLKALLSFEDSPAYPRDYRPVNTRVITIAPGPFDQQVSIAAGSNQGVTLRSPVVNVDGNLVGVVSNVFPSSSQVTLLTDPDSAVAAYDATSADGVRGLIQHGQGNSLVMNRVTKDQRVLRDDVIVTAGTHSARLRDLYPRGIPIGRVTSAGQTDVDLFKEIQVTPFVDFSSLDAVAVLISKKPQPVGP